MQKTFSFDKEMLASIFQILLWSGFLAVYFTAGFVAPLFFLVAIVSFVFSILYPRSGIFALVVLTVIFERYFTLLPMYYGGLEIKFYPIDIVLAGIFLGTFFLLLSRKVRFAFGKIEWALAIFFAIITLRSLVSFTDDNANMAVVFSTWKNYVWYPAILFSIVALFNTKESVMRFLKLYLFAAVVSILFIFIGIARGQGLWVEHTVLSTEGVRLLASTHTFYMSMALIGVVAYWLYEKDVVWKRIFLVLIPFWFIGIIGGLMRHMWVGIFVAIISLFLSIDNDKKKRLVSLFSRYAVSGLALVTIVSALALMMPWSQSSKFVLSAYDVVSTRFSSIVDSEDQSIQWRGVLWQSAIGNFETNPVFGIGSGKSISIEMDDGYEDFVEARSLHNTYLAILVQFGLLGILSFIAITFLLLRSFWMKRKNINPLVLMLFGTLVLFLVAIAFQPHLETNMIAIFFWLCLGFLRVVLSIDATNSQGLISK